MRRNTPAFRHGEATSMIRKQTKRRALDENTWDSDCCPRYSYARMISSGNGSSKGPLFCLFLLSLGTCRTMLMTGGFAAFPACTLFEFCTDIHPSPLRYVTKDVPPTSVPWAGALWLVGTVIILYADQNVSIPPIIACHIFAYHSHKPHQEIILKEEFSRAFEA